MPETVYRESRSYTRERDDHSSDDDRYSRTTPTVRRYKVTTTSNRAAPPPPPPAEFERTERIIQRDYDVEDDRRSRFSSNTHHSHHPGRSSGDLLEIDTTRRIERTYPPERPHSAFEPPVRNTTVVEKVVERDRPPVQEFYDITRRSTVKDDGRTLIYEKTKEIEREHERSPAHDYYDMTRRSTVNDDGRSVVYEKTREIERSDPYPPPSERSRTVVEKKVIEREDDRWYDDRDRARTLVEKKVVERERHDDPWYDDRDNRSHTVVEKRVVERDDGRHWDDRDRSVYEQTTEIERQRGPTSPRTPRDWDHHSHSPWDRDNVDVRLERRVERRDDGVDVTIQRRTEERRDEKPHGEYQHYRRETEYFEPPPREPAPIIIRPPALEQRIIVQDAPEPAPIIVPYRQPEMAVARRPDPREEDEYYYRRREIERYDGRRDREDDYAIYRHGRERDHYGDGYASEDDVIVRRTIIRRERSRSPDHHHRLHLAEGAAAGAGLAALAASRKNTDGVPPTGRGRKVLAGAALGALGTEVFKRAHSAYQDRHGSDERYYEDRIIRGRSRSRPGERSGDDDYYYDDDDRKDKHSKLKTGLGLAAAALAVAGAAKYYQSQKIEKEELRRGRSRNRRSDYSDSEDGYYSRSHSRGPGPKPSKGGPGGMAAAAAGTAAVAGLVHHLRSKSRQRKDGSKPGSKSRSRSRLRTGAEIVAAGLVGAAGKRMYDQRKERKDAERERELSDEEYERGLRERSRSRSKARRRDRSRSRSRSVSRSRSRSRPPSYPTTAAADPELGLVEYGGYPLRPSPPHPEEHGYAPAPVDAAEERRRRRAERLARKQRERQRSRSRAESSADDTTYDDNDKKEKRARSRSRLRDLATGAVAAGAAAIGVNKYNEHKKEEKRAKSREREASKERSISRDAREERRAERERARKERDKARNHYEESIASDPHDDYGHQQPPSPPTMSGGAYYGPPQTPPAVRQEPPPANASYGQGFTQHPNVVSTDLNDGYRAYNPQDFVPRPPPGPPPNTATTPTGMPPPPTGGHRPLNPDHVSRENGLNKPPPYRSRDPSPVSSIMSSAIYTPARIPSPLTATQSHVQFGPLSPQSSQTLLHLRATRSVDNVNNTKAAEDKDNQQASSGSDAESAIVPKRRFRKRRRNSDPSANRPLVSRHRDGPVESDRSSSPPEEEIEVLPDRFDTHGQPIDGSVPMGSSSSRHRGWTQRQGEFEYRSPRPGGSQVRGSWGVAGSDPEHVERVMREVTGALSGDIPRGVGGWLGLASKLLGGAMGGHASLHDEERQADEGSSGDGGNGSWRRHDTGKEQNSRRGWSNKEEHDDDDRIDRGASGYGGGGSDMSRDERGKGRRRTDDHGYDNNNEDENGLAGNGARRRRRRRRRDMD